jgi:hypothetical protein
VTDNRYAPPVANVDDVASTREAAPALWNPGAATAWSLLFSPAFGAFLHMKNWEALGEPLNAASSKLWCIVSLGFLLVMVGLGAFLPESKTLDQLSRIAGLALLIGWYVTNGKVQVAFVKQRFGKDYPRRGWGKPIGLALLAILALFAVVFVVVLVGELMFAKT